MESPGELERFSATIKDLKDAWVVILISSVFILSVWPDRSWIMRVIIINLIKG